MCFSFSLFMPDAIGQTRYERVRPYPDSVFQRGYGAGIRWAPFQLIGRAPALHLGFEYPVTKAIYFQHEFGLVYPGLINQKWHNHEFPRFQDIRGLKSRQEIKIFFASYPGSSFYMSFEFLQHFLKYDREETFAVNVTGLPGIDFYQQTRYSENRTVLGGHIKIGWEFPIDKRIHLDLFLGLGTRYVNTKNDLPEYLRNTLETENAIIFFGNDPYRPSASLGIALIYRLKKSS